MASPSATTRTRMTRRDFELIARVFQRQLEHEADPGGIDALKEAARDMANDLGRVHPKFDHDRFLTACGVTV